MQSIPRPKCHGPRVLTGYTYLGYEIVILENELIRVVINVGRGGMIPEFLYKPCDLDVLFKNPNGTRHHASFTPGSLDTFPVMDHHPGGWYECFPSGSTPVKQNGVHLGFHGEVWGLPFNLESVSEDGDSCRVTISGFTVRTPWKLTKTFTLKRNDPTLYTEEIALNQGEVDLDVLWGQHPMFGAPFLDAHCFVETDATGFFDSKEEPMARLRWPLSREGQDLSKVRGPKAHAGKMLYLTDFAKGQYRLVSPTWKLAFEMCWDAGKFPYCWMYENAGELEGPWWGRAYALALEPFTGLPNALEEGHGVISIGAGQSETVRFEARVVAL